MPHSTPALLALSTLLVLGGAAPAHSAALNVANNGTDSATCGAATAPCRSITQAIANAAPEATIIVGPGRYGDLNDNGTFGETGEEPTSGVCGCMIDVKKKLTIVSRDGANATIIDAKGASVTAVLIEGADASGTLFGKASKGFTLAGGAGVVGLTINGGATGVVVAGNISSYNDFGFRNDVAGNSLANNRATGNSFQGIFVTATTTLTGNLTSRNANGIWLSGGGPHTVKGNVSTGNAGNGFIVDPGVTANLTKDAAIENGGVGILLNATGAVTVTKSSIFGNDTDGATNCGLTNFNTTSIDATNNFWGAPTGPGPDPADGVCLLSTGGVTTTPFLTKEVKVGLKALK